VGWVYSYRCILRSIACPDVRASINEGRPQDTEFPTSKTEIAALPWSGAWVYS
jgi:hypothetical protein